MSEKQRRERISTLKHNSIRTIKKLYIVLLIMVCIITNSVEARADVLDKSHKGSIALTLKTSVENIPIEGAEFAAYWVADCVEDSGKLRYKLSGDFVSSGIDLTKVDRKDTAKAAANFAKTHSTPVATAVTDASGNLTMDNLTVGLYLVIQTNSLEKYSTVSPFFIAVGIVNGENVSYDSDATPKIEVVKKGGTNKKDVTPPVKPTPEVTPTPPTVVTPAVVTPTAATPALPQTGQDRWQIPVLLCIGLGLVFSGLMMKMKKDE